MLIVCCCCEWLLLLPIAKVGRSFRGWMGLSLCLGWFVLSVPFLIKDAAVVGCDILFSSGTWEEMDLSCEYGLDSRSWEDDMSRVSVCRELEQNEARLFNTSPCCSSLSKRSYNTLLCVRSDIAADLRVGRQRNSLGDDV